MKSLESLESVLVHVYSVVLEGSWFAPWSDLENSVDFVELGLHGLDPVPFAMLGYLPHALIQFNLFFTGLIPFVIADQFPDFSDNFRFNIQRGQDDSIDSKCQCTNENGVPAVQNISALLQDSHCFGQITVSEHNATEGVDELFGQFVETGEIHCRIEIGKSVWIAIAMK